MNFWKKKNPTKKIEWSLLAYRYTPSEFDMRYEHIIQNHRPVPLPPSHPLTYNNNYYKLMGYRLLNNYLTKQ